MNRAFIIRPLAQAAALALLAGSFLLCGLFSDRLTNTTPAAGQIAARLAYKSPTPGMVIDPRVDIVEIKVHGAGFDTSARFLYSSHKAEILKVPVGMVTLTVNGLDNEKVIYSGDTIVEVLRDVVTRPVITMTSTEPIVLVFESPQKNTTVGTRTTTLSGFIYAEYDLLSFKMNNADVNVTGVQWSSVVTLADGKNTYVFTAWDKKGKRLDDTLIVYYSATARDTTGPVLAVIQPTDSAVVGVSSITVTGTASDPSGIQSVVVNGNTASGTTSWSKVISLSTGANTIIIVATDNNATPNVTRDTITVIYSPTAVDSVVPYMTIDKPHEGDIVSVPNATVSGTASDLSGILSVTVNGNTAALSGTAWVMNVPLSPGENTIIVVVTDNSAHKNKSEDMVHVTYDPNANDDTPPLVAITSPSNNTIVSNGANVTISGTASDASDIAAVTVNGATASYSLGTWTASINLAATGSNTVRAIATDGKGNKDSAAINIILDTSAADITPPSISLNSPKDNQDLADSSVLVQVMATDANGIDMVTINGLPATLNNGKYERSFTLAIGTTAFKVIAVDKSSNHNKDTLIFALKYAIPATPTGVTAVGQSNSSILVSWPAVAGASSYSVYRCATSTGAYTAVAAGITDVSYTNAGLSASTTWYYKVSATNNAGISALSAYVSARTNDRAVTVPASPAGVTAVANSASKITVSWNPVAGADSCVITRTDSAAGSTYLRVGRVTGSMFADSGLTSSRTYYYIVFAWNSVGPSMPSNIVIATTMALPAAPVISSATAGDGNVTVSWNLVSGATLYNLYYRAGTTVDKATGTKITGVTSPRVVTGLTNGTQYAFAVSAVNGAGESGLSGVVTATAKISTEYDSLAVFKVVGGVYTRIYRTDIMSLSLLDSAVLAVRGYRKDGLGWELVSSNWDISSALKPRVSRQPPQNTNSWSFQPNDTGSGYIKVSFVNNVTSTIKDSIHVLFKPGPASVIEIYPMAGVPTGPNVAWPKDPLVADTMSADSIYSLLYAKVFNNTGSSKIWLSSYETVSDSSRKINWSVSPVDQRDSLFYLTGNRTQLKSTQVGRLVRVTASIGTLAPCSILILVKIKGMKLLPAGTFQMGQVGIADAGLVHSVTLSAFYMDTTEVTQADYLALMGVNPSFFPSVTRGPVDSVTWFDAVLYCNKRSKRDGLDTVYSYSGITGTAGNGCTGLTGIAINYAKNGYRLPTEAEWEYSCRAQSTTKCFWGNDSSAGGNYAWWSGNSGGTTHTVATRIFNQYGLYDMAGNVYEWNNDWHGTYAAGAATNPTGPASGSSRVLRGGSWSHDGTYLRSAYRHDGRIPDSRNNGIGFRVVLPVR